MSETIELFFTGVVVGFILCILIAGGVAYLIKSRRKGRSAGSPERELDRNYSELRRVLDADRELLDREEERLRAERAEFDSEREELRSERIRLDQLESSLRDTRETISGIIRTAKESR